MDALAISVANLQSMVLQFIYLYAFIHTCKFFLTFSEKRFERIERRNRAVGEIIYFIYGVSLRFQVASILVWQQSTVQKCFTHVIKIPFEIKAIQIHSVIYCDDKFCFFRLNVPHVWEVRFHVFLWRVTFLSLSLPLTSFPWCNWGIFFHWRNRKEVGLRMCMVLLTHSRSVMSFILFNNIEQLPLEAMAKKCVTIIHK